MNAFQPSGWVNRRRGRRVAVIYFPDASRRLSLVDGPVSAGDRSAGDGGVARELLRHGGRRRCGGCRTVLRSVIVKRGSDGQADEAVLYERFVVPMELPAPGLIHQDRDGDAGVLVLADVGRVNLEQEPSAEGFLAAAEFVATIRMRSVGGTSESHRNGSRNWADRVGRITVDLGPLTDALAELHRVAPTAVVHGDFVPKNLVTDGTRWTAVDWPLAYLAPAPE